MEIGTVGNLPGDSSLEGCQKRLELLGEIIEKEAPKSNILNLCNLCILDYEMLRRDALGKPS